MSSAGGIMSSVKRAAQRRCSISSANVCLGMLVLLLAGCTTPSVAPREYLDEQTAATITAVAEPWIFVEEGASASSNQRDYLNVHAIDVNRMGSHRQYLAVMRSFADSAGVPPTLELRGAGEPIVLQAATEPARSLGIAQPVAPEYSPGSKWWYFPVDKQTLATVAQSRNLSVALLQESQRKQYIMWRDGSAELAELTTVLP